MMRLFCNLFFLLFFTHLAYGQAGEKVMVLRTDNIERGIGYNANKNTYVYEEPEYEHGKQLTFEDLLRPDAYKFMQIFDWGYNKVYKKRSFYWYKITIVNQNPSQIEYAYEPSLAGKQEFRVLHKDKITTKFTGIEIPYSKRDWKLHPRAILLRIPYQDTVVIVGKVELYTRYASSKDVWIGLTEAYKQSYLEITTFNMFFEGALLIMFLYNLLLFCIVRDRAYLYYSLYIICMAWFFANSYLPDYLPEREIPELSLLTRLIVLFPTFFYTLFVARFFLIKFENQRLYQYFRWWTAIRLVVVPIVVYVLVVFSEEHGNFLLESLIIADLLISFVLLFSNYKKRKILTLYMVLGLLALTVPILFGYLSSLISSFLGFQLNQENLQFVAIGILLEIVLFSLGLGYRSTLTEQAKTQALAENEKLVREQNVVLEQKVTERTLELKQSNEELNSTLETIAKQRDDIIASINYARRIQTALLPTKATIQAHLPECMLFYLPKDIVSGDFYWFSQVAGKTFLAIADCTGHGVPGAFMTVIGENLLEQIVNKDAIYSPSQILTELDTRLLKTLQQQGINTETVHDGMDISLLQIDLPTQKIVWAGAKRPLWVFEAGKNLPTEYKGDKYPIGSGQFKDKIFTEKEIQLQKGDTVYAFTDGFADQFGQEGKLTVRRFRELLQDIHLQSFQEQERILAQKLQAWRGAEAQTDDVLVMAITL